eukprot:CAMPEP_0196653430 /NCGR_PEP_ID=MMETSP1086-20130531/3062_1 /TAXON_ID=77921 /ORGANISM="Cyanoptyche  gloeocystis , Strain SAG4.97" /LENGTH=92 /DNA_ID=CAMNT_0041984627 /DNA_START=93 /DNA_END=368 /DNA_ORIENTATION=-
MPESRLVPSTCPQWPRCDLLKRGRFTSHDLRSRYIELRAQHPHDKSERNHQNFGPNSREGDAWAQQLRRQSWCLRAAGRFPRGGDCTSHDLR